MRMVNRNMSRGNCALDTSHVVIGMGMLWSMRIQESGSFRLPSVQEVDPADSQDV